MVRDLGTHIDTDVSMRSHVMKTTSACFAVLRQLRGIRRSVPRTALAIGDECGRTARLRVIKVRSHHSAPTPVTLPENSMVDYKLAVLVYKCLHGLAPLYLADELHHPAESEFRRQALV